MMQSLHYQTSYPRGSIRLAILLFSFWACRCVNDTGERTLLAADCKRTSDCPRDSCLDSSSRHSLTKNASRRQLPILTVGEPDACCAVHEGDPATHEPTSTLRGRAEIVSALGVSRFPELLQTLVVKSRGRSCWSRVSCAQGRRASSCSVCSGWKGGVAATHRRHKPYLPPCCFDPYAPYQSFLFSICKVVLASSTGTTFLKEIPLYVVKGRDFNHLQYRETLLDMQTGTTISTASANTRRGRDTSCASTGIALVAGWPRLLSTSSC
jgi:hypothetical protein